jgi:serine/threonine-protein kinase
VFDEIACGGMANVFLACRLGAGESARVVAIKRLFEQFAKQPEFVTMFLDEAHLAERIRHANVVTTYEFLRVPDSLAIVMEFVLGLSLNDLLRIARDRRQMVPPAIASAVMSNALAGLHAAHEATDDGGTALGVVHRDISPHNVLVGKDGTARVIDFGIAKAAGRLQVTDVGIIKGKFAYMAPEQIRGGMVDRRTDIYSAGIVLWEALTGQQLFSGSASAEIFSRRAEGKATVPAPSELNTALPRAIDRIIRQAVEDDPDKRFSTAADMARALGAVVPTASAEAVAS